MSTEQAQKKNYKQTLNLPQTPFAMEAKLVANEPKRLACWREARLYEKILVARANCPKWMPVASTFAPEPIWRTCWERCCKSTR